MCNFLCSASFADVLEKILPADGTTTIGNLISGVLIEMGKLPNFSLTLVGIRVQVPLNLDASVLVGQTVFVKYLPIPPKPSEQVNISEHNGFHKILILFATVHWNFIEEDGYQYNSNTSLHSSSSSLGKRSLDGGKKNYYTTFYFNTDIIIITGLTSVTKKLSSCSLPNAYRISPQDRHYSLEDMKYYSPRVEKKRLRKQVKLHSHTTGGSVKIMEQSPISGFLSHKNMKSVIKAYIQVSS